MSHVFISHSNRDFEITKKLGDYLESKKIICWWDFKLEGGKWASQIQQKLLTSNAAIVVLSKDSFSSYEVSSEVDNLIAKYKKAIKGESDFVLIPFYIDGKYKNTDTDDKIEMDIRYKLHGESLQAVVLSKFKDEYEAFDKIRSYLPASISILKNDPKDFVYDDESVLHSYKGTDKVVYVPDFIKKIDKRAFCYNSSIEKVIIPDSVEEIGSQAFYRCENLLDVTGMKGVIRCSGDIVDKTPLGKAIEGNAVILNGVLLCDNNESEKTVNVPETVEVIAEDVFRDRLFLSEVLLPLSIKSIGRYAFTGCVNLKKINMPENLKFIGKNAFENCPCAQELVVPGVCVTEE